MTRKLWKVQDGNLSGAWSTNKSRLGWLDTIDSAALRHRNTVQTLHSMHWCLYAPHSHRLHVTTSEKIMQQIILLHHKIQWSIYEHPTVHTCSRRIRCEGVLWRNIHRFQCCVFGWRRVTRSNLRKRLTQSDLSRHWSLHLLESCTGGRRSRLDVSVISAGTVHSHYPTLCSRVGWFTDWRMSLKQQFLQTIVENMKFWKWHWVIKL
jgi:hypothetical protein